MGARSKKARKIRRAGEFDLASLTSPIVLPRVNQHAYSWSLEEIRAARDDQMRGHFYQPARMAEGFRTDSAIFTALTNRLAPLRCLPVAMKAARGARGDVIAAEADGLFGQTGVGITSDTIADAEGCLAVHGVAFALNSPIPREDGSRVDWFTQTWPIEWVRWDPITRGFVTRADVDGGLPEVPIVHGDGRWVIFQQHELEPWKHGALLSLALVWARHAFAGQDWAKGSQAHGNAKVIGELPTGIPIKSPEGEAFLVLLRAMWESDLPVGIRPAGAKTEFVTNGSTNWQVWKELMDNAEKAAARILLGTDGILGSQGGAPGVDISELMGVATTRIQGDVGAIERGILTGVIEPWTAVNFGDSSLAPSRQYLMPDPDEEARHDALAKRQKAFFESIEQIKSIGFDLTQELVDSIAESYGVQPPALPAASKKAPSIALAPIDIARVVKVNEARASAGLDALTLPGGALDPDGMLTVEEYSEKKKAAAAQATPPPAAAPPAP